MPAFGRIPQPDQRNRNYPIRTLITATKPRSYTWACDLWLDQGNTPSCVAHAVAHEIAARPVRPLITPTEPWTLNLYQQAQTLDGIRGPHDGTSVLAAMKAATQQGFYHEYRWAFNVDDLALAIGHHGPAIIGVNWYTNMMDPTQDGYIIPTGRIVGGHAVLIRGVHTHKQPHFTIRNSWGKTWGLNGDCKLAISDMATLLKQDGDACIPVTRQKGHE